jgi:hypothetical protein
VKTRKPLIKLILDRIEQKARCECSTQIFGELCDDLVSAEELRDEHVQKMVIGELDRMIEELQRPSEDIPNRHLKKIRQEIIDTFVLDQEQKQHFRERTLLEIDGDAGYGSYPA